MREDNLSKELNNNSPVAKMDIEEAILHWSLHEDALLCAPPH